MLSTTPGGSSVFIFMAAGIVIVVIIKVPAHVPVCVQARSRARALFYLLRNGFVPLSSATDKILIREFENLK